MLCATFEQLPFCVESAIGGFLRDKGVVFVQVAPSNISRDIRRAALCVVSAIGGFCEQFKGYPKVRMGSHGSHWVFVQEKCTRITPPCTRDNH